MVELDNGKYIIGFDNGYQFGKTANFMFDNGVFLLGKIEPSVREHSLKSDSGGRTSLFRLWQGEKGGGTVL